jgi:hypothetical protein
MFMKTISFSLAAGARGPRGFKPGLEASIEWLRHFKKSGTEPELPAAKTVDR